MAIASADLTRELVQLRLERLVLGSLVEPGVAGNSCGVGHHFAKVVPYDVIKHVRLHWLERTSGSGVAVSHALCPLDAGVVAEDMVVGSLRVSRSDRVAAAAAAEQTAKQAVVIVDGTAKCESLIVVKTSLNCIEQIRFDDRWPSYYDPVIWRTAYR